jgi:hypothetical protein
MEHTPACHMVSSLCVEHTRLVEDVCWSGVLEIFL